MGYSGSVLGFGTFMLNGEACEKAVLSAIKEGYCMIDTAEAYGNEAAVGNAIVKSGIDRKKLFLVTKVNYKSYENTTMHGVNWKSSMKRENYGLSVCQILNRHRLLI